LKKQKRAQNQEKLQTKHKPEHTNIQYNSKNDKKTKSPKPKLTQKCPATQLHRTKTTTAIVTTKFWPTSSGSSEFGHPESITVEFLPIHHPEIPHSQFDFLDTKEHQPTMPQHAKMDVIRTKQSDIVSALVTLSKYTAKVYTPMTPHQFHLELQTLERMKNLSTRASVTARTGQNLAPRVGPYAYYYRLFEDFYEIIQMEYDKLLTQAEYLNDHKYRLITIPPPPDTPRYTNNALYAVPTRHATTDTSEDYDSDTSQKGLRNILAQFRTSDDDDSDASPKYSPTGQCDSSINESESDSDSESDSGSESPKPDEDSDVEIIS
jgi:hypothetical protein